MASLDFGELTLPHSNFRNRGTSRFLGASPEPSSRIQKKCLTAKSSRRDLSWSNFCLYVMVSKKKRAKERQGPQDAATWLGFAPDWPNSTIRFHVREAGADYIARAAVTGARSCLRQTTANEHSRSGIWAYYDLELYAKVTHGS